jgi:hypothetical protein
MHHDDKHMSYSRPQRPPRLRRAGPAAALVASAMLIAACGGGSNGPAVAGTGSPTSPKSSTDQPAKGSPLAYAKCMRSHGVPDFPDPKSNGELQLSAGPGSDLGPDAPQFQKAQRACRSLLPAPPTPAQQSKDYNQGLKFAKCMRSHGVALPDPPPPGHAPTTSSSTAGNQGPDPNSPLFQAAQRACRSVAPGGGGSGNAGGS